MSRVHLSIVPSGLSAMSVEGGIAHFLDHLRMRGYALHTLKAYASDMAQYAEFVARVGQGDLVAVQSSRHVARFLDDRSAAGDSRRTQARKLSCVRRFFQHAIREGWTGFNPAAEEQVKWDAPRVVAPELDQLHAVIAQIPREGAANLRDRALLRLLLDCGQRISGTLQADIPGCMSASAIDLRRGLLHFTNKGGRAETAPFNEATAAAVEAWLPARANIAAPGVHALIVGARGLRLSRGSAHHIIATRGAAAGVRLHAHLFRHRRVVDVLETCGDKVAQQFAKHRSLATTSLYGAHADNRTQALVRTLADVDGPRQQGRAVA